MPSSVMDSFLEPHTVDVLVLGAGTAGYQAAIAARRQGASAAIFGMAKGASPYILGFNVANPCEGGACDDFIQDTSEGGYGLGEPGLIRAMVEESWATYTELRDAGVPFELDGGAPRLRHLSGSRSARSVFVPSGTGKAIHRALVSQAQALGVEERLGWRVVALLKTGEGVAGALMHHRHDRMFLPVLAQSTVLALGGIGRLFDASTYPSDIGGDSYSLALSAGAVLRDMEFVQFEPTVIVNGPPSIRGMEMPTAMLGDGAILTNAAGERFMRRVNPDGIEKRVEKAKMALAIQQEIDEGRGYPDGTIAFDARHLGGDALQRYQTHYHRLISAGIDPERDVVHIAPAAHSLMGGVRVDTHGATGVPGLFACGEAAAGVHGASRIAGNGATDAIVLGRRCGRFAALEQITLTATMRAQALDEAQRIAQTLNLDDAPDIAPVAEALSQACGIHRDGATLARGVDTLRALCEHAHDDALSRAALVSLAVAESALLRTESRGAHYRKDFPKRDDARWRASISVALEGARLVVSASPIIGTMS